MAKEIIPRTQSDELNDAQYGIVKARALVDVLYEMSAPGGDSKAGAIALEQLNAGSLNTTLSVLNDILIEADGFVQAAFSARSKAAAKELSPA